MRLTALIAASLIVSRIAAGQSTRADSIPLSLGEAVNRALSNSEEIRLARSQVDLAETQVRSAKADAFPQLNANLGYTRTFASA